MLAAILADSASTPGKRPPARLAQLNTSLRHTRPEARRGVVEEARRIALDNLEFLRLLTNLEPRPTSCKSSCRPTRRRIWPSRASASSKTASP
jgi:type II secretory pathway predicted ATPase ExeA